MLKIFIGLGLGGFIQEQRKSMLKKAHLWKKTIRSRKSRAIIRQFSRVLRHTFLAEKTEKAIFWSRTV